MADDLFSSFRPGPIINPGYAFTTGLNDYLTQRELMEMKREEQKLAVEREHRMQQSMLEEMQLRREESLNAKLEREARNEDRQTQLVREAAKEKRAAQKELWDEAKDRYQPGDEWLPEDLARFEALGMQPPSLRKTEQVAWQGPLEPTVDGAGGQLPSLQEAPPPATVMGPRLFPGTAKDRAAQATSERIQSLSQIISTTPRGSQEHTAALYELNQIPGGNVPANAFAPEPVGKEPVYIDPRTKTMTYRGQTVTQMPTDAYPVTVPAPAREGLTPSQEIQQTRQLRNDFVRETRSARTITEQLSRMKAAMAEYNRGGAAAGAQGVLVTFQKSMDPESVVRESEYARSSAGLSLMSRMEGAWEQIKKGGAGVPKADLQTFVDLAAEFAKRQQGYADQTRDQINGIADKYGLDRDLITRDVREPGTPEAAPGPKPMGFPSFEQYQQQRLEQRKKATP